MYTWLMIGAIVLLLGLLLWAQRKTTEGFVTQDADTLQAQRQQLQWEGERRYNPLARLQDPTAQVPNDTVTAALQNSFPVATANTSSLMTMLGVIGLGAADDGSNKQGAGVEQTGVVAQKIAYCESLKKVDCDQLKDPRAAECGFCHADGIDSRGKAHRGGMYISSDDQIRAGERAAASGQAAEYTPTVGTCSSINFTVMRDNCLAREAQLKCQSAGAATLQNQCGQCYGAAPANATGLLLTGPKVDSQGNRIAFPAFLHVTHPGAHDNGSGMSLVVTSGSQTLGYTSPSANPDVDPRVIPLTLIEGQPLTITVYGAPAFWAAWLSNKSDNSGTRVVSVDVGEQSIEPANGFVIAGDKRAGPLVSHMASSPDAAAWSSLQAVVPNTVLFYMRRAGVQPGAVVQAFYGVTKGDTSQGVDVTPYVKIGAGEGIDIQVLPGPLNIVDPAPGIVKHLWVDQDDGGEVVGVDGQTLPRALFVSNMIFNMQVPASLIEPALALDKYNCPTGPIVLTEVGAGLMGSHSCFGPGGKFNPSQYCLQELFQAAGGTQQGAAFPNTDAKVAALVQKDTTGTPNLDQTVSYLNNLGNIAMYGTDMNGAPVDFPTYKAAAQAMLGITPRNPCDGPMAATGPHSAECLDYLYRTSGNPGADASPVDPTALPYAYCGPAGLVAPLNADGTPNQTNVAAANGNGGVAAVRQYFQSIYNRAQDNSDFDAQAAAMRNCFNINMVAPPETPASCPPPNPDDWRCLQQGQFQGEEVFNVCPTGRYSVKVGEAESVCATYGARLATPAEIGQAHANGAQWCACSWATDSNAYYPMQQNGVSGCGSAGVNNCGDMSQSVSWGGENAGDACVTCVGKKPPANTQDVSPFAPGVWNDPTAVFPSPSVTSAYYGVALGSQGVDVTQAVQTLVRSSASFTILPSTFSVSDPAPGIVKQLWVTQSNGSTASAGSDGQTVMVAQMLAAAPATAGASAFRLSNGVGQCASADGQNCYTFADTATCQAWITNPSSNAALTAASVGADLGQTLMKNGRIIYRTDDQAVMWNPNGTNIANPVTTCSPLNDGTNWCASSMWAESLPASQFNAKYTVQANFNPSISSVLDTNIKTNA